MFMNVCILHTSKIPVRHYDFITSEHTKMLFTLEMNLYACVKLAASRLNFHESNWVFRLNLVVALLEVSRNFNDIYDKYVTLSQYHRWISCRHFICCTLFCSINISATINKLVKWRGFLCIVNDDFGRVKVGIGWVHWGDKVNFCWTCH